MSPCSVELQKLREEENLLQQQIQEVESAQVDEKKRKVLEQRAKNEQLRQKLAKLAPSLTPASASACSEGESAKAPPTPTVVKPTMPPPPPLRRTAKGGSLEAPSSSADGSQPSQGAEAIPEPGLNNV